MKNITEKLKEVIQENRQELLIWFSNQVYERMVVEKQGMLVKLKEKVDFSRLEEECSGYHAQKGVGRSVEHSVGKLLRVLLVRYLTDSSLRETEEKVQYEMRYKYFAGYHLFERGPDHSRIHEFEKWVMSNHPRLLFDEILKQIDAAVPEARGKVQIGDTFALVANAQEEGVTARLRHGCKVILRVLKKENQASYEWVIARLNQEVIWRKEKGVHKLSQEERQAKRMDVAGGTLELLALLAQAEKGEKTQEWIEQVETVIDQSFEVEGEKEKRVIISCRLKRRDKGEYVLYSMTDPQATRRNHGEKKKDFGYNVSVAATTDFIREIEARPGSEHDSQGIVPLLEAQKEHHDFLPEKLVYDQAAGTGKVAAQVDKATRGQTQLVADPVIYADRKKTFGPHDFVLSEDESLVTCPNDQQSYTWCRDSSGTGRIYRFSRTACRGCSLRAQCRRTPELDTKREVFFSDHHLYFCRLLAYSQTPSFALEIALRPRIERVIATLTRFNGARYARFRGQAKVDFQMKMCATALNLKRWLTLMPHQHSPPAKVAANVDLALIEAVA